MERALAFMMVLTSSFEGSESMWYPKWARLPASKSWAETGEWTEGESFRGHIRSNNQIRPSRMEQLMTGELSPG